MSRRTAGESRFVEIFTEVGPDLLSYFERRVGPDGADLLSITMTVVWRRFDRMPVQHEEARMWLFGIARNVLRNDARSKNRRHRFEAAVLQEARLTPAADAAESIAMLDLIHRLDPELAEVIQLVHWERLSLSEIAQLQNVPASTVRSRYQRAKALLRESIAIPK